MKKYIIHNFSFLFIKKKYIYIRTHEMEKILTIKLIFHHQETRENYLFYLQE